MSDGELKRKYAEIARKLHYCRPAEKAALQTLFGYYFNLLRNRGLS